MSRLSLSQAWKSPANLQPTSKEAAPGQRSSQGLWHLNRLTRPWVASGPSLQQQGAVQAVLLRVWAPVGGVGRMPTPRLSVTLPLFASDSSFILKGMATIPFFLSLLGEINQIIHLSCLAECLTHNKPLF